MAEKIQIPSFIVRENNKNASYILLDKNGSKMIALNGVASIISLTYAITKPTWVTNVIAGIFISAMIIWVFVMIYLKQTLKKREKQT